MKSNSPESPLTVNAYNSGATLPKSQDSSGAPNLNEMEDNGIPPQVPNSETRSTNPTNYYNFKDSATTCEEYSELDNEQCLIWLNLNRKIAEIEERHHEHEEQLQRTIEQLQAQVQKFSVTLDGIYRSKTYLIGRICTYPVRKLKKALYFIKSRLWGK